MYQILGLEIGRLYCSSMPLGGVNITVVRMCYTELHSRSRCWGRCGASQNSGSVEMGKRETRRLCVIHDFEGF